jgi:hypothetical protein
MTFGRKLLIALVVILVLLGVGYGWGAAGRGALQTLAEESRQGLDLAESRGAILEARVSLYNNNFGEASKQFEEAKAALRRLKARYQDAGEREAATAVDAALGHVEEAQRLSGKLDSGAQNPAGQALEALKTIRRH